MKKAKIKAELESKIERLRQKYPDSDSQSLLDGAAKEVDVILGIRKFLEHPTFEKLIQEAHDKISDLNALLLNDKDLPEEKRLRIFIERDVWKWILKKFGVTAYDDELAFLEKTLDDRLKS